MGKSADGVCGFENSGEARNFADSRSGSTSSATSPEAKIKDPFVLEFLGLKDEYSEAELEESLIRELEHVLMELESLATISLAA
jgi:predicted nuclease of restriction endonuclease-like (RecB) superfamily